MKMKERSEEEPAENEGLEEVKMQNQAPGFWGARGREGLESKIRGDVGRAPKGKSSKGLPR